jgi:hypothetical protein
MIGRRAGCMLLLCGLTAIAALAWAPAAGASGLATPAGNLQASVQSGADHQLGQPASAVEVKTRAEALPVTALDLGLALGGGLLLIGVAALLAHAEAAAATRTASPSSSAERWGEWPLLGVVAEDPATGGE